MAGPDCACLQWAWQVCQTGFNRRTTHPTRYSIYSCLRTSAARKAAISLKFKPPALDKFGVFLILSVKTAIARRNDVSTLACSAYFRQNWPVNNTKNDSSSSRPMSMAKLSTQS